LWAAAQALNAVWIAMRPASRSLQIAAAMSSAGMAAAFAHEARKLDTPAGKVASPTGVGARLGNLFDRAPGRTVKVSLLGGAVVVALGAPAWELAGMALVLGAGVGLLVPELRERCMLGDTGSNVLGAAVGFGLVVAAGATGEWVALAIVVALNAASEVVSFTKVIDRTPPLRWLDRVGSLPERGR
jgi:hypothetical protein